MGKKNLAEVFGPGSHGTTFGGNPICVAAAEVVVNEIFQPEFLEETVEKGNYLINELKKQLHGADEVVEVRGLGLMVGIELDA